MLGLQKERHHQRNVALGHVEEHRLDGVVLFAGLGDVYDLRFFDQLRQIRARPPAGTLDVARFAFGSALLWHPSRWDSFPVSEPDASQDDEGVLLRLKRRW
uniref:Glycosyltransferases n=1 Tax=Aegilops tauschii TaxID=37682 RepID=M8C6G0_AEGTA